ncbi:MAG: hypothetical protein ASARMPREDX12_002535 [Alectoria sarmentosa]|nr:MAG: hypothetical protein ASARMPREDX12_002535 [Alectoria sarmentosa]
MENFPIQKMLSEEEPMYPAPWDPDVPFTYTSLYDLAEASSKILDQREAHFYATYQMLSTSQPTSYREVCASIGKTIGKDIKVKPMPFQKTMEREPPVEKMFGLGENAHTRDVAQRMLLYYSYRGLIGSTNIMRWLLGREPTGWEGWVSGKMEELGGK